MNEVRILLHLCLVLFGAVGCYDEPQRHSTSLQVDERAKLSLQGMKDLAGSEDFKRGIPSFVGKLGGVGNLININYSGPPKQVIKAVGDAIVPMISAGLSLIPGGALIGGIVEAAWGILSGLFGGPAAKSPMEIMIEDIKEDINNIKKNVAALKASLNITIQKHLDEKLSKIINRAIHGELRRNEYVCSKYAILSGEFSYDLKNNLPINESIRTEMIAQIHDCDNFLKDTTEAFAFPEYADVLWVSNVITTLVRVSFLTEICNYGAVLGIDPKILSLFWSEIKVDLKKAFEFYIFAVKKKAQVIKPMQLDEHLSKGNFTTAEYEGCVMQAQLLYLDGEMYPYGVPQYFRIFNEDSELKIADYNVTEGGETRHIQVYYNDIYRLKRKRPDVVGTNSEVFFGFYNEESTNPIFNCIIGPDRLTQLPKQKMSFRVNYVKNKIYEMRVLYFAAKTSDRKVKVIEESGNNYIVTICRGTPSAESVKRFVFHTAFHHLMNPWRKHSQHRIITLKIQAYSYSHIVSEGAFIVENVLAFTVRPNDVTTGKIEINDENKFNTPVYIFGVEFVVLPLDEKL